MSRTVTDPAELARRIGVHLFRLQLANRDIGRAIEDLQVALESIDFSVLPSPRQRKPRRRVKVTRAVIEYRIGLLDAWRRYKQAEAVRAGWEGGKEPWTNEHFAAMHAKSFHVRRVYDWLSGVLDVPARCPTAKAIERALKTDIARMKAAGITDSVLA